MFLSVNLEFLNFQVCLNLHHLIEFTIKIIFLFHFKLAVTVCNLNPVHKTRFCESKNISKPENVEKILCASLDSLMEVCNVYKLLEDLVADGEKICKGTDTKRKKGGIKRIRPPFNRTSNRRKPINTSSTFVQMNDDDPFLDKCSEYIMDKLSDLESSNEIQNVEKKQRNRRQINFRSIFKVIRALSTGQFNSFREILEVFGISGNYLIQIVLIVLIAYNVDIFCFHHFSSFHLIR